MSVPQHSENPEPGFATFHAQPAYLGFRDADFAQPYARFLRDEDAARAARIAAQHRTALAPDRYPAFADLPASLSRPGYGAHETGWSIQDSGTCVVAVHTPMPGVDAAMWDWWFSWHGGDSSRYKIWSPAAHLVASWRDGAGERSGLKSYIGRTSLIKEMIGRTYLQGAIRFVDPASIGFAPDAFDGTVICGRAGEVDKPIEHTWLIHQVRNTDQGCEMRSRFYLGQDPTINGTKLPAHPPGQPRPGPIPIELLEHCATEMHHLAGFLPELYATCGPQAA